MQEANAYHRAATIIDLEERSSPDPHSPSAAAIHPPQAHYAIDASIDEHKAKKRKIERACDFCRRRKTKCDGPKMQDNVCTNCLQTGRRCTYIESSKPRGPPKAYITALEDRVEKTEALLRRLRPEADFIAELGPPVVRGSWKSDLSSSELCAGPSTSAEDRSAAPVTSGGHSLLPLTTAIPRPGSSYSRIDSNAAAGSQSASPARRRRSRRPRNRHSAEDSSAASSTIQPGESSCSSLSGSDNEESAVELSLVQGMTHLTLRGLRPANIPHKQPTDGQWRFHGKSSSFKLINAARVLKQRHMEEVVGGSSPESPETSSSGTPRPDFVPRRLQYWDSLPWEIAFEGIDPSTPSFVMAHFPPLDLAESLINIYFTRNNSLFPLLHRPTFDRQWRGGLYQTDLWFASVCMALFAVASRWSNDPRVLSDHAVANPTPEAEDGVWALAGYKYVDVALDAHRRRRSLFLPPNLFEVQTLVLMAMYFRGTVAHAESWTLISIGLRKAQDVGAHRKKVYGRKPTVEEELWRRTIWHLIAIDRLGSMLTGRPCCSRDEDFDLDLPLEVDDEYWVDEKGESVFHQPPDKPALVSAFVYWVKLSHIAAFALRTLYAIGRSKQPLGLVGPRWREEVVTQLNEAMLEWTQSLPPHLKWNANTTDDVFGSQSAMLHMSYYIVQITIYRPFIPVPGLGVPAHPPQRKHDDGTTTSDVSVSALSICAHAAKAGTAILEVLLQRGHTRHTVLVHYAFLYSGVLLVNRWTQIVKETTERSRRDPDFRDTKQPALGADSDELSKLISILNSMRPRWELAREACDCILEVLPPAGEFHADGSSSRIPIHNDNSAWQMFDSHPSNMGQANRHPRLYYPSSGPQYSPQVLSPSPMDPPSGSFPLEDVPSRPPSYFHDGLCNRLLRPWLLENNPSAARRASFADLESEAYWSSGEPQVALRRRRTFHSFEAQTFDEIQSYSHHPSFPLNDHVDTTSALAFGAGDASPSTMHGYIKRERHEEGGRLLREPIVPPVLHDGPHAADLRNLYRTMDSVNVDQELGRHGINGYRLEQWQ